MQVGEEYLLFLNNRQLSSIYYSKYHVDQFATEQPIEEFSTFGDLEPYAVIDYNGNHYRSFYEQVAEQYGF